jgi:hypothetical protein
MKRETIFSPCRQWRYTCWREWGVGTLPVSQLGIRKKPESYVQFLCLNPSIADETIDDPTVRRCIDFAKRWGYGAFVMTNIFAWRDTDPEAMKKVAEPIGPDNDEWLVKIAREADLIIGGWGKHGKHLFRGVKVKQLITSIGKPIHCLEKNSDGSPKHPLYIAADKVPILL